MLLQLDQNSIAWLLRIYWNVTTNTTQMLLQCSGMLMKCYGNAMAMQLQCYCNAIAMLLQCYCNATAMLLQCNCNATAMLLILFTSNWPDFSSHTQILVSQTWLVTNHAQILIYQGLKQRWHDCLHRHQIRAKDTPHFLSDGRGVVCILYTVSLHL